MTEQRPDDRLPRLFTFDELAERAGVTKRTIQAWVRSGRLRVTRLGDRTPRVTEDDFVSFLRRCREGSVEEE